MNDIDLDKLISDLNLENINTLIDELMSKMEINPVALSIFTTGRMLGRMEVLSKLAPTLSSEVNSVHEYAEKLKKKYGL